MVHGKKRIPYWIDWRLLALQDPNIMPSFGLPIEPEDSQYGEYRPRYYASCAQNVPLRGISG